MEAPLFPRFLLHDVAALLKADLAHDLMEHPHIAERVSKYRVYHTEIVKLGDRLYFGAPRVKRLLESLSYIGYDNVAPHAFGIAGFRRCKRTKIMPPEAGTPLAAESI